MPVGAAIGGAAVIGGVATSKAASKTAKAAQSTADQNNALQREIYERNVGIQQPFVNGGTQSYNAFLDMLGLNGAASDGTTKGYEAFKNSTGYQQGLDQGQRQLNASAAAKGGLLSGAAAKEGLRYGQSYSNQFTDNYLNKLLGGAQIGQGAANALSGVGTNYVNGVSANNNTALNATAAANTAGANAINGIAGNAASAFGYAYGNNFGQNALSSSFAKTGGVPTPKLWG